MSYVISGIQQIGVGVKDADEAWKWYRRFFGADVPVFTEKAEAGLMLPYTGGQPRSRYAILALNMQGGGGFEIWQYTSREPQPSSFDIQLGDYGIFSGKIKSPDVKRTYEYYQSQGVACLSEIHRVGQGPLNFFARDPYGNIFQVVEAADWFQDRKQLTGGVYGAVIGVSDIGKALTLYRDVLGYDEMVYDETGTFESLKALPGGTVPVRRVLLRHKAERAGAFAPLLGRSELELVQVTGGREPRKIYDGRFWGDLGFIHLCFDVNGMDELKARCEAHGYPFTVDSSNSFDMGEAAGRFSYIEDPDGTLIEFVETHKVPIMKKLGWYLNLKKRKPTKPLPRWMIKAMSLSRVKD
ncbi:VOC family protein [Phaeodactylibacter luteus]|uniref:VOC family protein n=1 Tax=Phaeodactylibacter luteus TaxID=1564516 RepID=A0A5C6RLS6_9BACT|nr:VOC family protein [Phaeodactylibacter luteus]TXB62915.1 VOC family protein [Phaeodactylibacter luteus]